MRKAAQRSLNWTPPVSAPVKPERGKEPTNYAAEKLKFLLNFPELLVGRISQDVAGPVCSCQGDPAPPSPHTHHISKSCKNIITAKIGS